MAIPIDGDISITYWAVFRANTKVLEKRDFIKSKEGFLQLVDLGM